MANNSTVVIVGGGLTAAKAAEGLRDNGFKGRIVLVAEERHLPCAPSRTASGSARPCNLVDGSPSSGAAGSASR